MPGTWLEMEAPDSRPVPLVIVISVGGILVIGAVDFVTGVEYRVLPLYYLPLSVAAWHLGRPGGLAGAALCALSWMGANYLAGLRYSSPAVWVVNVAMQAASFVVVALLVDAVRTTLMRAEALARTDHLTGMLNRRAFGEEAERILGLAQRHQHPTTVAYIDLDDFKGVNDQLGHDQGDVVLRTTAMVVRDALRVGDIPARVGGDEFVILLPETGPDGARTVLERLRTALTAALGAGRRRVTASIGAVSFLEPPLDVADVVRHADALMYSAKAAGKDRVLVSVVGEGPGPHEPQAPREAS